VDPLHSYKIGFSGLSLGNHIFRFDIDRDFFDCFEQSEIHKSAVHLDLTLEKEANMLVFDFEFSGWAELNCDRCLESYRQPIDQSERLFVKFGDSHVEQSEDVIVIPYGESHFDIAQLVYEYLHLALPIRRAHPVDEHGNTACNKDMIEKMKKHSPGTKKTDQNNSTASTWDALKSLNFKDDKN
jgi:uncharacterized protein